MRKIITLFTFLLLFISCKNDIETINQLTFEEKLPDLEANDIDIIYSDSGYVQIQTFAPVLQNFASAEKPYTVFPEGIETIFYDKQQQITSEMTANYAKYIKEENLWELKYSVKLKNVRGDVLKTEHLFFDEAKEILYTQKFVSINLSDGSIVSGKGGFESNFEFTKYRFVDVSGKYNFKTN